MAILNFLKLGSYSALGLIFYSKQERRIAFELDIYDSPEKKEFLLQQKYSFDCNAKIRSLYGTEVTSLPESLVGGADLYHLSKDRGKLEDKLREYPNLLAKWDDTKQDWWFWTICDGEKFYDETNQVYLMYDKGSFIEVRCTDDYRIWERYFSPQNMLSDQVSLHSAIYNFLKTLPEFQGCQDG